MANQTNSFAAARDAILQADEILTGGENKCTIWHAFSSRGLVSFEGYSQTTETYPLFVLQGPDARLKVCNVQDLSFDHVTDISCLAGVIAMGRRHPRGRLCLAPSLQQEEVCLLSSLGVRLLFRSLIATLSLYRLS